MNIDKLFPFSTDVVFRARRIASFFALSIELKLVKDADSVRFPAVAAVQTLVLLLEPSVYMCFHPLYLFSMNSLNLFWKVRVRVLSLGRAVRDKFIIVLRSSHIG